MIDIIPITYYTGVPNVGDLANANLVSAVGNANSYQISDVAHTHLLAVGSTMEWAQPKSIVWGTGVIHPSKGVGGVTRENIYSLRGELTRQCLYDQKIPTDVPIGDPAFLLPSILGVSQAVPSSRLGVIPHYADRSHPFFVDLIRSGQAKDLDVRTGDIRSFLESMATCEAIVSSSLHGLIFAEALGIPHLWIEVGQAVQGNGFKFLDWFSTTLYPQNISYKPSTTTLACDIRARCRLHGSTIDKDALLGSFPRARLVEAGVRYSQIPRFLDFSYCRSASMYLFIDVQDDVDRHGLARTIDSAASKWPALMVVLVGSNAEKIGSLTDNEVCVERRADTSSLNSAFMRKFWENWAEPQQHVIAEPGFDFSDINPVRDVNDQLNINPGCDAIIIDRMERRSIYRRPGRWY